MPLGICKSPELTGYARPGGKGVLSEWARIGKGAVVGAIRTDPWREEGKGAVTHGESPGSQSRWKRALLREYH